MGSGNGKVPRWELGTLALQACAKRGGVRETALWVAVFVSLGNRIFDHKSHSQVYLYVFFWNKQEWSPIMLSRREWKEGRQERFREAGGICFGSAFQFHFPRECSAPVARGPALCCLLGGF